MREEWGEQGDGCRECRAGCARTSLSLQVPHEQSSDPLHSCLDNKTSDSSRNSVMLRMAEDPINPTSSLGEQENHRTIKPRMAGLEGP